MWKQLCCRKYFVGTYNHFLVARYWLYVQTNVVRVDSVRQGTALRSNKRMERVLELAKTRYDCMYANF